MRPFARVASAVCLTALLLIGAPAKAFSLGGFGGFPGIAGMHGTFAALHHGGGRTHRGSVRSGRSFGRSRGRHLGRSRGRRGFGAGARDRGRGRSEGMDRGESDRGR